MRTSLLCEQKNEIVYLEASALVAVDRTRGELSQKLLLQAPPPAEPEEDCGMGTCYFQEALLSADGQRTVDVSGRRSNYYGSWSPSIVLREHGKSAPWRAICPGERPLAVCFTARRTVQIQVSGDRNQPNPRYAVDYLATQPGTETRETLHLTGGKVRLGEDSVEVRFTHAGFTYRFTAPAGTSKGTEATLRVERGHALVQTEPCVAFGLWPQHLAWAAQRRP